jgi:hypothetical protein
MDLGTAAHHHDTIDLTIQSTRGTRSLSLPKTAKVAEVIEQARVAFGLASGDRYELVRADQPGEILLHERTIESYHLTDGTVLTLTWTGGGV